MVCSRSLFLYRESSVTQMYADTRQVIHGNPSACLQSHGVGHDKWSRLFHQSGLLKCV